MMIRPARRTKALCLGLSTMLGVTLMSGPLAAACLRTDDFDVFARTYRQAEQRANDRPRVPAYVLQVIQHRMRG